MDYKYIEQLIESYFDCQTTLQEEQILRSFFAQEDVPAHLARYAALFQYETEAKDEVLGEDFDQRIMAQIREEEQREAEVQQPKAHIVQLSTRHFTPFFKAAAVVAMALTIGRAAEHAIGEQEAEENTDVIAVDPYIKSGDVLQTIRIKDVSQAEVKAKNDSIITVTANDEIQ
ncbi:MAG: anti-sigma factor [Bacteroidaceae bacterium]|nr:anti-sigma factor [Bacteroidaceae bacterium]